MCRLAHLLAVLLSMLSFAAAAQPVRGLDVPAGTYLLDKTHASLLWRVNHMGLSRYTARFTRFDAVIDFDPAAVSKSRVRATIDTASVETDFVPVGGRDWNAELRSPLFFATARFPEAVFESRRVELVGERRMRVEGDLTLLGVTRPAILDVTLNGGLRSHPFAKVAAIGISANGTLSRKAHGMDPPPVQEGVGDAVELIIEAEFFHKP